MPERGRARNWSRFLLNMRGCCSKILRYSQGLTKQHSRTDDMMVDADLRNLEVLGEAAKQNPPARFVSAHPGALATHVWPPRC